MLQYTVTALPVSKTLLGEGPHWDEKSKKLYYVDILRNTVFSYDPVTSIEAKIVIGKCANTNINVFIIVLFNE
jgi:sugar lactone lactonase YvrE